MIKAKIQKINEDDKTVLLLTEHGDELYAGRYEIDFGILEGDNLFLRTESGEYKFRRVEKGEAQEGEPHYYDANWNAREEEHATYKFKFNQEVDSEVEKIMTEAKKESESNMIIGIVIFAIILIGFLILRS